MLPKPNENRGLFAPILVLVAGLLATAGVWRTLKNHEDAEVHWVTKLAAQVVRSDIVTDMEWQRVGLDRLALLWEAAEADPPEQLWIRNAELYLQHRPGSIAVEWLSPNFERRILITRSGNPGTTVLAFGGVPKALLADVADSRATMFSAPALLPDGKRQWAIAHPVLAKGQPRGFIVSFFDLNESWNYILDDLKNLNFSFAILLPDEHEYLLPGSSREHEQDWGQVADVPLAGVTWQVRVWPKSDVVLLIKSRLPEATLAAGSALSLLIALVLYFAVGAARSSMRMRQANQELEREINLREGAQEELRRAHAQLEVRVEQRTAALAGSNALLQKEVTEHERAEQLLRDLTGRLFQLQDEERRRLARELHDGAVQDLVAMVMDLGLIRDATSTGDLSTKELVNECMHLVEKATTELRTISYLLHPPYFDELGLAAALRDLVDGFVARSGIRITLHIDPALGRLRHELELGIYRIVQEALSNIYRHAQSRTATISLARDADVVHLEVADAGRGIPPDLLTPDSHHRTGVGITGMRERVRLLGGRLEIQSSSSGTRLQAVLPVPADVSFASAAAVPSGDAVAKGQPTAVA